MEQFGLSLKKDHSNVFFRCVEDSSEAVMITDVQGVLRYVNPSWCRIYGFSEAEAIGATPSLLHSGHQERAFYDEMWRIIRDPEQGYWKGELTNKSKTGELIPVLLTITPFRNDEGLISGYMGIAVDMRSVREMEREIRQQDRLASIGMIASGLAHEIGTPLGVIRGRAEMLKLQSHDPSKLEKTVDVVISQIDRISKLIGSLLKISRRDSKTVSLQSQPVYPLIDEILTLLEETIKKRDIEIIREIDSNMEATFDYNQLQQVLINLIVNAYQAVDAAKREGRTEGHYIKIKTQVRENGMRVVSVHDSGTGISEENIKKLFHPFFTTKDVGEGTGLGLAIADKIVSDMGGKISVSSKVGVGTEFNVLLPE